MQAAILAGGLGTRLMPLTHNVPKAMVPVLGKPFLEWQLALLHRHNVRDVVLLVGHMADQIESYFGDGARVGMRIRYSREADLRLDTAGAIKHAEALLDDRFMVLFGDSYLRLPYERIADDFIARGTSAMMVVYRNDNAHDTSDIELDGDLVAAYRKTPPLPGAFFINHGLTLLRRDTLAAILPGQRISLQAFLAPIIAERQLAAWETTERFYEIGSFSGLSDLETLLSTREPSR